MYALGVVGYQCLAGRPPFHGNTPDVLHAHQVTDPPSLPADVPPALSDLVLALLAKDPSDRPSDAAAIASQAQRMASRHALDGVRAEEAPAEPYPAEAARAAGPTNTDDPVTRVLTVHRRGSDPSSAATSAIATPGTRRPDWNDIRQIPREHPTALAVGVLVVLVLAATLLTTRALSTGPSTHRAGKPAATHSASAAAKPVGLNGVTVVGGGDHPEELHYVTDASASTAWYTEHYASASFGGLKSGVGLLLRIAPSAAVKTVVIRFADAGIAAKLYAGNAPSSLAHGKALAATSSAPAEWRVALSTPVKAQSWLIWITNLVPDSGGYRAGVAAVRFLT